MDDEPQIIIYNKENKKIEIIPKEKKDNEITNKITNIQQCNINFTLNLFNLFLPHKLLLFKNIMKNKIIIKEELSNDEKYKYIELLYNNLQNYLEIKKCNIEISDKKTLHLNINSFKSLTEFYMKIIFQIIRNKLNLKECINKMINDGEFKTFISNEKIWNKTLYDYISYFKNIEFISFSLSDNYENFEIEIILLFYYLYGFLFKEVNKFYINLNIKNNYNSYQISKTKLLKFNEKNENLIISNLILINIISKNGKLKELFISLDDSNMNEFYSIFTKQFENDFINNINIFESSLYFKNLMYLNSIEKLSFEFVSLDPMLFIQNNELILRFYNHLTDLKLFLFPYKNNKINFRKILFNHNFFKFKGKTIDNNINNYVDSIIIHENKSSIKILNEEKIPKFLFDLFIENLNTLRMTLDLLIISFKLESLEININPYPILEKYDLYTINIIFFIYNILLSLKNSQKFKIFSIECYNINNVKNIVNKIKRSLINNNSDNNNINKIYEIDFSKNEKISELHFNLKNISYFFTFDKLPYINLKNLSLENLDYFELKEYNNFFIKEKTKFINLKFLKISVNDYFEYNKDEILIFFSYALPLYLEKLIFTFQVDITVSFFINIIDGFYKNEKIFSIQKNFFLFFSIQELIPFKQRESFQKQTIKFFENKLIKNNILYKILFQNVSNNNLINNNNIIILELYKFLKNPYFINIIFCFKKILKKTNANNRIIQETDFKKIFTNIFLFMGLRKYIFNINI